MSATSTTKRAALTKSRQVIPAGTAKNVIYPFGYGLSYTDFSWEVNDDSVRGATIGADGKYEITVTVTNTGSVAGKDVVELYGHAPYYYYGIEKPYVTLLDFAKTPLIQPGQSASVTLTFDPFYLASYDYSDANGKRFSGYELEGYDANTADSSYCLFVAENSHDYSRSIPFNVPEDGIKYKKRPRHGRCRREQVHRKRGRQVRFGLSYNFLGLAVSHPRRLGGAPCPYQPSPKGRDEREVSDQLISFLGEKHNTDFSARESRKEFFIRPGNSS